METFAKNIARGGVNLHISKLFGEEVQVFIHVGDSVAIEIRQSEKRMLTNIGPVKDPETIAKTVRSFLKTVELDCNEVCCDYYIFIELEEVSYLQDIFEMDGIEFDFEKCPVCLTATQTKTSCNHALCSSCLPKCKKCPMCRAYH